ncbi:MAG: hypothetical protein AAGI07_10525 [Bacteroidota bacterium]
MCKLYGTGFTKLKLVDEHTVSPYQKMPENDCAYIDMQRAKNEIALYDTNSKETVYGIDAMIAIISQQNKAFKKLLKLLRPILLIIYKFISYNRKVIYPAKMKDNERDCTPDFHLTYRWVYILTVALFTGWVLHEYIGQIYLAFGLTNSWQQEVMVCFGQILWQSLAIYFLNRKHTIEYLGNMSTVSLLGSLLLLPPLLIQLYSGVHVLYLLICFMVVVSLMLLEHIRRCKLKNFPAALSVSWVLYRTFVLVIIFPTVL